MFPPCSMPSLPTIYSLSWRKCGSGDQGTQGPGVTGRLPPRHKPAGEPPPATAAGQGSGSERQAKRPERGMVAGFAAHRTGEGGDRRPTGPPGGKAPPGLTRGWTARRARP